MSARRVFAFAALTAVAGARAAEEALDPEFLEYLATLEGDEEDWTWFWEEQEQDAKDSAAKPARDEEP